MRCLARWFRGTQTGDEGPHHPQGATFQTKHTDKTARKATGDKSYSFVAKADSQMTLQSVPVRAGWTSQSEVTSHSHWLLPSWLTPPSPVQQRGAWGGARASGLPAWRTTWGQALPYNGSATSTFSAGNTARVLPANVWPLLVWMTPGTSPCQCPRWSTLEERGACVTLTVGFVPRSTIPDSPHVLFQGLITGSFSKKLSEE